MTPLSRALIRTHHITSRKKILRLKAAAKALNVNCLIRSGGVPGVMFVEGKEANVRDWVDVVHGLRYKDYQLVVGPGNGTGKDHNVVETGKEKKTTDLGEVAEVAEVGELREVESVKEMGAIMDSKGLRDWWRVGMGFVKGE